MPELPEVETIARQLETALVSQNIRSIKVLRTKSFIGNKKLVTGQNIVSVSRRAKVLIIDLTNQQNLLIHLKMTGQLIYRRTKAKASVTPDFKDEKPHFRIDNRIIGGHPTQDWFSKLPTSHTRVILKLTKGTLFFNDMRVFGWIKQVNDKRLSSQFANYGPDINSRQASSDYFYQFLKRSTQAIKVKILDQTKIAGIGNIYANDALHLARIKPTRKSNSLTRKETDTLLKACKKVINLGIKHGGASESDFIHLSGAGGKYQRHFRTYKKEGAKCIRRDGGVIKKVKLGGRGTFYCPVCQK